jgi:hypothetical protein
MLSLIGVIREFKANQLRGLEQRWIRYVGFHDNTEDQFFIVSCSFAQAKAFALIKGVEMDLSFKNVQGAANLFSISGWNEDCNRMLSICLAHAKYLLI